MQPVRSLERSSIRRSLTAAAFLYLSTAAAFAQDRPYHVDHWTTDNGLPQNTIRAIVQTRDGYLWLTTFDGLARFDGVRFTVFDKSNTPAITNNRFTALYEDRDGTLWAGADEGEVVAYREGVFVAYAMPETARGAAVVRFTRDFDDELMVDHPRTCLLPEWREAHARAAGVYRRQPEALSGPFRHPVDD